ncbi:hypothetical protein JKP88DRAFT_245385 [Tribonema minus]|uniref:MINDY4 N-terminal dimerisation domain-containing protein n=1 Tax=Tribonema minus TaxID=303371 RepID=A0A836CGB7_9STRA|nr:hypothetical protein JKP88DRAFT_245385 [Tribonema minus]
MTLPHHVVEDASVLLVSDWLRSKGLLSTVEALSSERHEKALAEPDAHSWAIMSKDLGLEELLKKNAAPSGARFSSVLEVLLSKAAEQQSSARPRSPPTLTLSMVDLGGKTGVSGRHKRHIVRTYTGSIASSSQMSLLTAPSLPHAMDTMGNTKENSAAHQSEEQQAPPPLPPPMLVSHRSAASEDGGKSAVAPRVSNVTHLHRTGSRVMSEASKDRRQGGKGGGEARAKPMVKASDVRKPQLSQESWIPIDLRMKMLRRSISAVADSVSETAAWEKVRTKQAAKNARTSLEIAKEQERFGRECPRPCALCEQVFSSVNLVLAVPYKAIMDVREHWHEKAPHRLGPPKASHNMKRPPQCYNEVRVCAFCSQQFSEPATYRPTQEMKAAALKDAEAKEEADREKAYWDPLRHGNDGDKHTQQSHDQTTHPKGKDKHHAVHQGDATAAMSTLGAYGGVRWHDDAGGSQCSEL